MTAATAPPAPPAWFDLRDLNFSEVVHILEIPLDTVYGWFRLIQATGTPFGHKFRGDWHFSTRELAGFWMATALRELNYPVGHVALGDIARFVNENDAPERPFRIGFDGCPAVVLIDAPKIYKMAISAVSGVRNAE